MHNSGCVVSSVGGRDSEYPVGKWMGHACLFGEVDYISLTSTEVIIWFCSKNDKIVDTQNFKIQKSRE